MFKPGDKPPNRCEEPGHERSEINGRCKTCTNKARSAQRAAQRKANPPRKAATFSGKPCKTCGTSTRYVQSGACVGCQRRYLDKHSGRGTVIYHIQPEFTRWVTSPLPQIAP